MIGRSIARTASGPARWLHRIWGLPSIHSRQKWMVVWPLLAKWPQENVTLLDAGCGTGTWSLEIAARRPGWKIVGIDLDGAALQQAEEGRKKLGLDNVRFIETDYLSFRAPGTFDVVISISSIHYAFENGQGHETLSQFQSWLKPQARLILYAQRCSLEAPFTPWKFERRWYPYFTASQLIEACARQGLCPEHLSARVGCLGAMAKEMHWTSSAALRLLCYPFTLALIHLDHSLTFFRHSSSVFWLLVARKPRSQQPLQNPRPDKTTPRKEEGRHDLQSEGNERLEHSTQ